MSTRFAYFIGLLAVIFLLIISFYVEYFLGMIPCPLCTLQRLTFCLLGIILFVGVFFHTTLWKRLLINTLIACTTLFGMLFAGRQIWIQHFPVTTNNDCAVNFIYLIETFPISEIIQKIIFEGGMECSKRGFELFHFDMAEWAFIWFFIFLVLTLYLFLKEVQWTRSS